MKEECNEASMDEVIGLILDNFWEKYSKGEISEEEFMAPIPGIKQEVIIGDER